MRKPGFYYKTLGRHIVVKFATPNAGEVILDNSGFYKVGKTYSCFKAYTDTNVWKPINSLELKTLEIKYKVPSTDINDKDIT